MNNTFKNTLKGIGLFALIGIMSSGNITRPNTDLTVTQLVVNGHDTVRKYESVDHIPDHIQTRINDFNRILKDYKNLNFDVLAKEHNTNRAWFHVDDPKLVATHKNVYLHYINGRITNQTLTINDEHLEYSVMFSGGDNSKPLIAELTNHKTNMTYTIYYTSLIDHEE